MEITMKEVGPFLVALGLLAVGLVAFQGEYKCEPPKQNEIQEVVPEPREQPKIELGKQRLHVGW